jgi:hypothetical protein
MRWKILVINKYSIKKVSKKIIKSTLFIIYAIFVGSSIIGGIASGIMTLMPDEASKPCYLGYYAHCSFTPYSTLILFAMAIIGTILLLKLIKYVRRQYNKFVEVKPTIKALIKS